MIKAFTLTKYSHDGTSSRYSVCKYTKCFKKQAIDLINKTLLPLIIMLRNYQT